MPNLFTAPASDESTPYYIVGTFVAIAIAVVITIAVWFAWSGGEGCPKTLHRNTDGTLTLDTGEIFPDMNSFQQWWHAAGGPNHRRCPIPILTGARRREVLVEEDRNEQTWAKTPINKVDDYEFSRIFGYERTGRMEIPQQNFNIILNQRQFDWPDKPLSSDERKSKYRGLQEGFTAAGDLKSIVMAEPTAEEIAKEAVSRYGEKRHDRSRHHEDEEVEEDGIECRISREAREVAAMVAKAYEHDPNFEPVVTKVGANQWEVNELKPRRRRVDNEYSDPVDQRVVDTANEAVDIKFRYRENKIVEDAIDPYFPDSWATPERQSKDPFYGPVPNMERMFGPTFDHKEWYKLDQGAPIMD
jgi:hypothetical protein